MALTQGGRVFTWGRGGTGSLGHGARVIQNTPAHVEGLGGVVDVAAGEVHSLAVDRGGRVYAWGYNREGQLGIGTHGAGTDAAEPVRAWGAGEAVVAVAAGWHSLALCADGALLACGAAGGGTRGVFTTVAGVVGLMSIHACRHHSCAMNTSGVRCVWDVGPWGPCVQSVGTCACGPD